MRAVVAERAGGPEVLRLVDWPKPEPGPGEVRVRIQAVALNHLDLWLRSGLRGTRDYPKILGCEFAGEIDAAGPGVSGFSPGERVLATPGFSCGRCTACLSDMDGLCRDYRMLGSHVPGGYAEFAVAPAVSVYPITDVLTIEEWSAFPLTFLTAYHMLVTRARMRAGENVLVQAAGSGVGTAAIQIAHLFGARVIATGGSEAKLAHARSLGADLAIDSSGGTFAAAVRAATQGRGADVIVEHVGSSIWKENLSSLAPGGRLVTCGATSGFAVEIDLRHVYTKQQSILGSWMGGRRELGEIMALALRGRLRPVIDRVYPLEQAAEAHRRLIERAAIGKVVLKP
jgi:NADPH:quinone reductase-like Zn-dependent oxidoreductase